MTGIYSAAAGMAAQQTWLDTLANDLANVNTPGYKHERVAFRDLVYDSTGAGAGAAATTLGASDAQGVLQQSDNPLALAVEGSGWFQVKLPDGTTALTRNGSFELDSNGQVVTNEGFRLEPPLTLPKGTSASDVTIASDGTVTATDGTKLGQVALVDVPAPDGLQPVGNGLFALTAASGKPVAASGQLHQHMLEASNVDVADAMTSLIQAQRAYQLESRAIQTQDQLLQIANQIRR